MKKCLVIDHPAGLKRLFPLLERASEEWSVILCGLHELDVGLPHIPVTSIPVDDGRSDNLGHQVEVMEWLNQWSRSPLLHGKSFRELMSPRGISLWSLMEKWIVRSSYFRPLWRTVAIGHELRHKLAAQSPAEVVSICLDSDFDWLVRTVCASMSIRHCSLDIGRPRLRSLALNGPIMLSAQVVRFLIRKAAFRVMQVVTAFSRRQRPVRRHKGGDVVMTLSTDEWGSVFDIGNQSRKQGDRLLQGIIDKLVSKYTVCYVVWLPKLRFAVRRYGSKARTADVEYTVLESWPSFRNVLRDVRDVRRTWRAVRGTRGFRESLCYRGVDFFEPVQQRIDFFFSSVIWETMAAVRASQAAVEKLKPLAILLTDEASRAGDALIQVAKQGRIPTVAVQHGLMNDMMYWRAPEDIQVAVNAAHALHSLPDVTCVWSDGDESLLSGWANYPPGAIRVTGAPHWDFVPHRHTVYNRARTCVARGLNPQQPVLVFLTSTLPWEECESAMAIVCTAAKRIGRVQLVVKLHPGDTRLRKYRRIARKMGLPKVRLSRAADLFELLYAADVVLAVMTTSVIEALLMNKPVVLLDPQGRAYLEKFHGHPALLCATSACELDGHVTQLLSDSELGHRLAEARRDFVRRWCGPVDGQAARRVVGIVEELISRRRPDEPAW